MAKLMAQNRLKPALKSNIPAASDKEVVIGSKVLVYKENLSISWSARTKYEMLITRGYFWTSMAECYKCLLIKSKNMSLR